MSDARRADLLAGTVNHVLHHGVATLSLRPLASALGTSDRMLLYYFRSRDALLVAVLDAVGEQLQRRLEQALPPRAAAPDVLLQSVWHSLRSPETEAHLRLYVEVSGLAARGQEPFAATAAAVATTWLTWMAAHLDVPVDGQEPTAAGLLAVLDGLLLVRFVASADRAEQAMGWLLPRLA